jgi:hypothetical protein
MRSRHRHFSYKAAGASLALDTRYISGTSDGSTVQTWSDISGNARDATQATAGSRATYKTAIQGGNPILRFDGGDFYNATFVTGTAYSIYIVYKRSGSNANAFDNATLVASAGTTGGTAANQRRYQLYYDSASGGRFGLFTNATVSNFITRNDNFNIHSVTAAVGSGDQEYLLNGGSRQTASVSGQSGVTSGSVRMTVGASSWDNVLQFVGDMGLLIAFETAQSSSLRRRLEQSAAYSFKIACS